MSRACERVGACVRTLSTQGHVTILRHGDVYRICVGVCMQPLNRFHRTRVCYTVSVFPLIDKML